MVHTFGILSWLCLCFGSITTAMALAPNSTPRTILVSGAGGQTGQSLFRKLLALPEDFRPIGLVRTEESKAALVESGVPEDSVAVVDVTNLQSVQQLVQQQNPPISAFCICTSAKPAPSGAVDEATGRPIFAFPNGSPEEVDWIGQKNQIDACPKDTHIIVCSTMGGTDKNHPLNALGRITNPDGTMSGGNIVKWKRKAEMYLMKNCANKYTIVHPGGLLNEEGGQRELVLGVDDLMDGTESRTVPRGDVAEVMLQALRHSELYAGRSFDLRAKPVGDGTPTKDFKALIESLQGKNCDYSLGETM